MIYVLVYLAGFFTIPAVGMVMITVARVKDARAGIA